MTRLERAEGLLRRVLDGEDVSAEIRAFLLEEEAPTQPGNAEARRRSSGSMAAVTGLADRVAEELRKGRE